MHTLKRSSEVVLCDQKRKKTVQCGLKAATLVAANKIVGIENRPDPLVSQVNNRQVLGQ